ncbi:hypothetical protein CHARACLAT_027246 [Characodon lateralis]|uniref:Uncharacterized protein n=1 Tax=Characodon lateralis TaxID=208331 RepID=A0ABU7F6W4_9TELE|nr:hypothetical protein [Characodon lateralis]
MQKDPWPGIEPKTFLLQGNSATNCATVQPPKKTMHQNYLNVTFSVSFKKPSFYTNLSCFLRRTCHSQYGGCADVSQRSQCCVYSSISETNDDTILIKKEQKINKMCECETYEFFYTA